ncbi:Structural maintenance of chromosomes protein 5 [Acipenser ruthenus]|uniref:Structural maintenance of chromosomes protein 5 n=1 Tax=Acipenser ruthenus TaxID=7906 RepID=A0A444UUH8_ACIRT|nr:Structural maintenance of chromosomes protein 5 [Acipenser ruthenus]
MDYKKGFFFFLNQIEDIQQALNLKRDEETDRQKRINNTRRMIKDWQSELSSIGDLDHVQPQIDSINCQLRQIQEEKASADGERTDLKRERDNQERVGLRPQAFRAPAEAAEAGVEPVLEAS